MSLFDIPIEKLKGIGEKRAKMFHRLGVNSVGDLILFYPRSYEDWEKIIPISNITFGDNCCIRGRIASPVVTSLSKNSMIISRTTAADSSAAVELIFFNNKYIASMLKEGEEYYFFGRAEKSLHGLQMLSPKFLKAGQSVTMQPIYNLTSGLSNHAVVSAVKQALKMLPDRIRDPLPEFLLHEFSLCDYGFALRNIHFPKDNAALETARRRLSFQELLILTMGLYALKQKNTLDEGKKFDRDFSEEFLSLLPFSLTGAQKRALQTCIADMTADGPSMHRLIQGDVGSGKTAVAAGVCYCAVKNGFQAAFMAPTEILAEQHCKSLSKLFENSGIKVGLLTGSLSAAQKKNIRTLLASGEINIVVGTHALITEATVFKNLGVVITDEQHRFGVAQRSKLTGKGNSPHLLVMSATPIPRTLGLTIFGDLDITLIDELPPGRHKTQTMLISSDKRGRALGFIKKEIDRGRQAYIVCPLVDEGESDLASAENYAAELMLNFFSEYPVGILHGKMKSRDKEDVMRRFASGEISVLVSTTVVEVGVDVPNATVIMIENAERFGLSQLHQLRGRVGRGKEKSYCILVSDNKSEKTLQRLGVMLRTSDGFKIAEEDLIARGPGDFFGERQHGLPELRIASLTDMQELEDAQHAVKMISDMYPDLNNPQLRGLRAEMRRLFSGPTLS